jgi:DNA polymerase/3'-5' exonuclease PolX
MKIRKKNNEIWKVKAYKKVIDILLVREEPIYTIDDINEIEGIGKSIKEKIEEIFDHNTITQISNFSEEENNKSKTIELLTKVSTIGEKKAEEFYTKHNIRTIEDLRNNIEILNDKQKIGLKYYEDEQKRIPYSPEMKKHEKYITETITDFNSDIICNIAGSYRRKESTSGDIDVLLTYSDYQDTEIFKNIVNQLIDNKYIKDTLAYGKKKFMGYCKLPKHKTFRRIDILYSTPDKYAFALLYFTGNQQFNIKLRNLALSLGYSLNEYGLTYSKGEEKGEYIDTLTSEEEILNFLGLKYIPPEKRINGINLNDYTM